MRADSRNSESDGFADGESLSPLELTAANWMIAVDRGLTAAQRAELTAWLDADPRHAEMFAEMSAAWNQLGRTELAAEVSAPEATVYEFPRHRRRAMIWFAGLGLAAAAAVVLIVVPSKTHRPVSVPAPYTLTAATEIGGTRTLALPDGSEIQLNTDSAVSVRLTAGERRIDLSRGEAYFHVAKDAARPFLVTAAHVVVRAVGTQFDVRMHPSEVVVLVTEGKVRLSDATKGTTLLRGGTHDEPPVLAAGERAVVPVAADGAPTIAAETAVVADEQDQALAWKTGRLEFVDAPLGTIVAEFNRYNRHKLVIGDTGLADRRYGGTFATTDYDAFVRVLENEFGFSAERRDDETVLHAQR